jgi:ABC-type sugar transport system ATPase subunit
MSDEVKVNDHLVLIGGKSGTGKSSSLRNLAPQEGVLYINCEAGKRLPFKNKFKTMTITDPYEVYSAFEVAEEMEGAHTIIVDSVSMLMDMFESVHVVGASDTMKQWGAYAQFIRNLMQDHVAKSTKAVIFTGHTHDVANDDDGILETKVTIKGAVNKIGVESFFSCVVAAKKVSLKELAKYPNDLLNITEDDEMLGFKHVFQTRLTKKTSQERIRAPLGMWSIKETYIDSDVQLVTDRLDEYYEE